MKTSTLFRAYVATCAHMEGCASARGSTRGIAVHDDVLARTWQRRARLRRKLQTAIEARLQTQEATQP